MPNNSQTEAKARAVREMFAAIARRYDFLNHFLSLNIDRRWRSTCVRGVAGRAGSHPRILDVGCGTADLSIALSSLGEVFGCDFCHPMLRIGTEKVRRSPGTNAVRLLEGDALRLPFQDGAFDVVASAFVLRNLADIDAGLVEMGRVLRTGGTLAVLDFSMPKTPLVGAAYRLYFSRILPKLGQFVSGVDGPYRYLPESVGTFPAPSELGRQAERAGFTRVEHRNLTGGVAFLLLGDRGGSLR
jgi:demethylmenaquinone methyltransferase / 2-methoxy-6-polyprenyl-1,4-benzoquinol methylase